MKAERFVVDFSQRPIRGLETGDALERGDRVPNFWLPDHTGRGTMFYEAVQGRPILLVLHRATRDAGHVAVLRQLILFARQIDAHLFAVGHGSIAAHAALGLDAPLLVDVEGRIMAEFVRRLGHVEATAATAAARGAEVGAAPLVVVCDPNQRLLGVVAVTDANAATNRIATLIAPLAARTDATAGSGGAKLLRLAPVLIVPDVLDETWRRRLIELWHAGHDEGKVATQVGAELEARLNYGTKRRLDHTITEPELNRALARAIARRIAPEMAKAFHFQGFWFEPFIVMGYDAARVDFFRPHRDNLIPAFTNRRFALTLNLNTDDYEGGDLRFPEYGDEVYGAPAGGAVVFSCSLLHEALPVTRGRRFAVLSFM
ncbi:MAG: 2OG-Fe(II) oxygenase, partial [Alphaproteobacteria bacterium]